MASSATAVVRSMAKRTEFLFARDLSKGASRSTAIDPGQYIGSFIASIKRCKAHILCYQSFCLPMLPGICVEKVKQSSIECGELSDQVGITHSFLIELTTALVNGEHSEKLKDSTDMAEYRRAAVRRKFIGRRQRVEATRGSINEDTGKVITSHSRAVTSHSRREALNL